MKTNTQKHRRFEIAADLLILLRLIHSSIATMKIIIERKMKAQTFNQKRSDENMTSVKSRIVTLIDNAIEQMNIYIEERKGPYP